MEMEDWTEAQMEARLKELVPIVGNLAKKYTAGESTSVTYERAQQLMEAVLYCIREAERDMRNMPAAKTEISAEKLYEMGVTKVEEKTRQALALYNEILPRFDAYENRCLYNTFVRELPEFFKRYDVRFEPQDTIITLDYPVREDLSGYEGIDKVEAYIRCIAGEQKFLGAFPREYVVDILRNYSAGYKDMAENICRIVAEAD